MVFHFPYTVPGRLVIAHNAMYDSDTFKIISPIILDDEYTKVICVSFAD